MPFGYRRDEYPQTAGVYRVVIAQPLASAEPNKLRYRLLHAAARLVRGQRRLHVRINHRWPWQRALATAVTRIAALPHPAL